MKFRKKPVVIEAEQWWPNKPVAGVIYPPPEEISKRLVMTVEVGYIDTLEGGHLVNPGDWIITGIKGEKYPCKPDIFEATYEEVKPCGD